jgi:hypothetical protein
MHGSTPTPELWNGEGIPTVAQVHAMARKARVTYQAVKKRLRNNWPLQELTSPRLSNTESARRAGKAARAQRRKT